MINLNVFKAVKAWDECRNRNTKAWNECHQPETELPMEVEIIKETYLKTINCQKYNTQLLIK